MAAGLQLLLISFLTLIYGCWPVQTLAPDCPHPDFVLRNGARQLIKDEHYKTEMSSSSLYLYMKPHQGFKGVFLHVTGVDGTSVGAWFPAEPQCFPGHDKWYQLGLGAWINTNIIEFEFWIGYCRKKCKKNYSQSSFLSLSMAAYGPSSWLLQMPPIQCGIAYWNGSFSAASTRPTCNTIPPQVTMTNETSFSAWPLHKETIIIATTVVGAAVVVVVAVVAIYRRRKSVSTTAEPGNPSQPSEPAMELRTIENEMYEPYDKYAATVTSLRHEEAPYVMENELYEPYTG